MHRERTLDRRSPDFRAGWRGLERALRALEGCGIEMKSAAGAAGSSPAHGARGEGAAVDPPDPDGPPDTSAMLRRMRAVLARELDSFCGDGAGPDDAVAGEAGGKAAVDLMSLIVRTLEKIDLLERSIAAGQAGAGAGEMSGDERAALRVRVRGIVERLARERMAEMMAAGEADADGESS